MLTTITANYQMIDVRDIQPISSNPQFKQELVDKLALSIIKAGGLISPLLAMQTGLQSYKLLDEYSQGLEYLAVVKAKELDPRSCEMVNVFVVSGDGRSPALEQLDIIKNIARYAR